MDKPGREQCRGQGPLLLRNLWVCPQFTSHLPFSEPAGLCQATSHGRAGWELGFQAGWGGQRQVRGKGESRVALRAARCTGGPGKRLRASVRLGRQVELGGRPSSGQL